MAVKVNIPKHICFSQKWSLVSYKLRKYRQFEKNPFNFCHVRSKVCMAPFQVRSEVCIAPYHVRSKVCKLLRTWMGAMQTLLRTRKGAIQSLLRTWSGDIVSGTK